jgi:hypothetical protein
MCQAVTPARPRARAHGARASGTPEFVRQSRVHQLLRRLVGEIAKPKLHFSVQFLHEFALTRGQAHRLCDKAESAVASRESTLTRGEGGWMLRRAPEHELIRRSSRGAADEHDGHDACSTRRTRRRRSTQRSRRSQSQRSIRRVEPLCDLCVEMVGFALTRARNSGSLPSLFLESRVPSPESRATSPEQRVATIIPCVLASAVLPHEI